MLYNTEYTLYTIQGWVRSHSKSKPLLSNHEISLFEKLVWISVSVEYSFSTVIRLYFCYYIRSIACSACFSCCSLIAYTCGSNAGQVPAQTSGELSRLSWYSISSRSLNVSARESSSGQLPVQKCGKLSPPLVLFMLV